MIDTRAIVDEVVDRLDADRKAIRRALDEGPPPPGLEPVDDATFMAFVLGMLKRYPPQPMIDPDGQPFVESPWMVALAYVEGGNQIVSRLLRIQRKGGE